MKLQRFMMRRSRCKWFCLATCLLACLLLSVGCQQERQPSQQPEAPQEAMSLQPARLSQQEQRLLALTGVNDLIFNYVADEALQSVRLQCYQLSADNQWQPISGGGQYNVSSADGRLALQVTTLADGLRVGVQSANGAVSASRKTAPQPTVLPEGMQWETVQAAQQTIVYQEELPLLIQYQRPADTFIAYAISDFYHPERFTQQGLHQVYALTIQFSRNQLGDNPLPQEDPDETDEAAEADQEAA